MTAHPLDLHLTVDLGDLLPSSATPLERALADVEGYHILATPAEIVATLWDPATCPLALLPYLAWALSVDWWDDDWPEATKRAVVAAAPAVHRIKGTRAAIERTLDALDVSVTLTEWWETDPPSRRGTFVARAIASEAIYSVDERPLLDARLQRAAEAVCRAAKPKSRVVDFGIGVALRQEIGLVAIASVVPVITLVGVEKEVALGLLGIVTISPVVTLSGMEPS